MQKFISNSVEETKKIASEIAKNAKTKDTFLLKGNLGAGKTAFANGFITSLCGNQNVTSPTFNIVQIYKTLNNVEVWHYDLYRIKNELELYETGIEEALENAICIIEWPEIAENFLKNLKTTQIEIIKTEENRREITVINNF